jgi:hypothetical protein
MNPKSADKSPVRSLVVAVVASAAVLGACSSSSDGSMGTGTSSMPETNAAACSTWDGTKPSQTLDAYGGGVDVVHESTGGHFTFDLVSITPPPPALGNMTWILKIADASGKPVTDATFPMIKTWMPQHQHSSTAQAAPTNNGDGSYTIDQLYLYMAGVWEVTFTAQSGSTTDSGEFRFCLGT